MTYSFFQSLHQANNIDPYEFDICVGIAFLANSALTESSQMSTANTRVSIIFQVFLRHFLLAKLASRKVKPQVHLTWQPAASYTTAGMTLALIGTTDRYF